jgi:hypothetical protein
MYSISYETGFDDQNQSTSVPISSQLYQSSNDISTTYSQPYSEPLVPLPFTWMGNFAETLLSIEWEQCIKLCRLTFKESGIAFVYNPIEYAFETHADYVRKYCLGPKDILFLGMNPGPFGMAQNGVSLMSTITIKFYIFVCFAFVFLCIFSNRKKIIEFDKSFIHKLRFLSEK